MKRLAAFVKATTLGGLFVVLPAAVVLVVTAKTVFGVREAVKAVMEKLTGEGSAAGNFPMMFAITIVVGLSFALGLLMISRRGQTMGTWIERTLLFKMPGYVAIRALVGGLSNASREGAVRPALLTLGEGSECFVLVTEDHGDGRLTIFIPGAPNASSGSVRIVRQNLVRILNVRITEISLALQQWGIGAQKTLAKDEARLRPPTTSAS
jgi:uncharacterized membrane protein